MIKDIKRALFLTLVAGTFLALLISPASAGLVVVFSDDFNGENGGKGELNYGPFAKWTASNGTVDLIGVQKDNTRFYDYLGNTNPENPTEIPDPNRGLYVDLDGSQNQAGIFSSRTNFGPGEYVLHFKMGGSHLPPEYKDYPEQDIVTLTWGIGNEFQRVITMDRWDPMRLITEPFTVTQAGPLVFHNMGGDNVGALLDDVTLYYVTPEPSTLVLAFTGALGPLGYLTLRRRQA